MDWYWSKVQALRTPVLEGFLETSEGIEGGVSPSLNSTWTLNLCYLWTVSPC